MKYKAMLPVHRWVKLFPEARPLRSLNWGRSPPAPDVCTMATTCVFWGDMRTKEMYSVLLRLSKEWKVVDVEFDWGRNTVDVLVEPAAKAKFKCPNCGMVCPRYDKKPRAWRHLDTCHLQTMVKAPVPRINCHKHGVRYVDVPWAELGQPFTTDFECVIIEWLLSADVKAVADRLDLGWSQVRRVMDRAVERGLARRTPTNYASICVDETSFQKRHEYVTVVTTVSDGELLVLHVADGRKAESLDQFYEGLSEEQRDAIETVSLDMGAPFIASTRNNLEDADSKIAFDKFHVAQSLGNAVNTVRREENKELRAEGDKRLVGTRFMWLVNPDNMTDSMWSRGFDKLKRSWLRTAKAWAMKEGAMSLWYYKSIGWAKRAWHRWLDWASRSRIAPMVKVAKMIRTHLWGILNAIVKQVNNGPAESMNAGIQRIKRRACGYRNRVNFRTAIYFHFGGLDLLPGGERTHSI